MIEDLLKQLTYNQAKLIKALMKSPNGLLSKELAGKTKVSNKSATLTPDVRNLLKDHGIELKIDRSAGKRFIVNVTCMALIRFYDGDKYYDDIRYILMDSYGYPGEFDDYPSTLIKFFYSDTKPMLDLLDK